MLEIKTTGFEDYLDGSANIKTLVIGGPGAGKTRYSSFWPKPFFIDCEDGRGSIADRAVPYVRARTSKDMLDVLEYLKGLERTPKAQRAYQTVVVDTADSFQRIVKEEWVTQTKAGSFSGFDAWGYLDTKMQLLFTRLLNLDYNVIVLVHYKDKQYKDGDNTVRELTLQLQGAIADQIFNDFGLVGWMGTYWEAGDEGRVQKRGLTFQPTPEKPFLKDRFHVTPKWMPVEFAESDYQQLFDAFTSRLDTEEIPEVETLGAVPDHERVAVDTGRVAPPTEGGPLPPKPVVEVPLEKQTKEQLTETAKGLGINVRGNALKSEIIDSIKHAQAAATGVAPTKVDPTPSTPAAVLASPAEDPWAPPPTTPTSPETSPTNSQPSTPSEPSEKPSAEPSEAAPQPAASASEPSDNSTEAVALVADQLGAEVISEERADTPATPQSAAPPATSSPATAPRGPSACADCGGDLAPEWADPTKKNAVRLSFVKHRRYLCSACSAAI